MRNHFTVTSRIGDKIWIYMIAMLISFMIYVKHLQGITDPLENTT